MRWIGDENLDVHDMGTDDLNDKIDNNLEWTKEHKIGYSLFFLVLIFYSICHGIINHGPMKSETNHLSAKIDSLKQEIILIKGKNE